MKIRYLTAGESHGLELTAILEGIPSNFIITKEYIDNFLSRRQKSLGSGGRMNIEKDEVLISSGVVNNKTTGGPIALNIINRDWEYRFETNTPISFTLDAGANVHLLYPANESDKVITFIKSELLDYCQSGQFIQDRVGQGAKKM